MNVNRVFSEEDKPLFIDVYSAKIYAMPCLGDDNPFPSMLYAEVVIRGRFQGEAAPGDVDVIPLPRGVYLKPRGKSITDGILVSASNYVYLIDQAAVYAYPGDKKRIEITSLIRDAARRMVLAQFDGVEPSRHGIESLTATPAVKPGDGFALTNDRDWSYVSFPGIYPGDDVADALILSGFKFSKRRQAYYVKRIMCIDEVKVIIGELLQERIT